VKPTFKVDENLPQEAVDLLAEAGFDSISVRDQGLTGALDDVVLDVCVREGRVLITWDLDFSDIRLVRAIGAAGVIVLRLPSQDRQSVLNVLRRLVPVIEQEKLRNSLWIVEPSRVRMRDYGLEEDSGD
jgi:predicted nuclease of predicted toxin-antitoxin system